MKTLDLAYPIPKPAKKVQLEEKLLRGVYEEKPELVVEALNGLYPDKLFSLIERRPGH